jgi:hypothetical protein
VNGATVKQALSKFIGQALIGLIRLYQLTLSRWLGGQCRFVPTCSEYAKEAIEQCGPARGVWLAMARIVRCNPCGRSGYDAPPSN